MNNDDKQSDQSDALLKKALRFTHGDKDCSLAQWGLEIKPGWYPVVDNLLDDIEAYCVVSKLPLPKIGQIKQKMASLRVHWFSGRAEYPEQAQTVIGTLIKRAECEAEQRCEICGASPAKPVSADGWYLRLCEGHAMGNVPRKLSGRPTVA